MQPLESFQAFDPELKALGFEAAVEGRIEAELLRRLYADPVVYGYFTGGIYPVEAEELDDEKGKQARSLYLALATTEQREQVGQWYELDTNWLLGIIVDRKPGAIGTGKLRRMAIARCIRQAILGDDHGRMSDDIGPLTEALVAWGTVSKPAVLPGGSLLVTLMPFKLTSNIDSTSQEFIE